jgi:hypothetical protein
MPSRSGNKIGAFAQGESARVDSGTVGRFELTLGAGPPHNSEDGRVWHEKKTAFYPDALGKRRRRFLHGRLCLSPVARRAMASRAAFVQRRVRTFSATISALKENTWASAGSTVTLIQ